MNSRFANKIALVTGGSSGIGTKITQALAAEGAIVHVAASGSLNKAKAATDGSQAKISRLFRS